MKLIQAISHELARHADFRDLSRFNAYLPSGGGFDAGCEIIEEESRPDRIVIRADFHHMNESGFYDGWTSRKFIVTPSFRFVFNLEITGRDKRGIKDYIAETFAHLLNEEI